MALKRRISGGSRTPKLPAGARSFGVELAKLGREMLVIPAQIWLAIAEVAGAATLTAWRRALRPLIALIAAAVVATYRWALANVTPARALVAVCAVGLVVLAASQWQDYRGISVGTPDYSGVEIVAPAPEVDRARAGDAHAWAMLPIAIAGLVVLGFALAGRPRLARLLIPLGIVAIAISVLVDAPKGLDEGTAAIAYEGAEAALLEGFWLQIAAGAVLIVCGLLLPRYLRPQTAADATRTRRDVGFSLPKRRVGDART